MDITKEKKKVLINKLRRNYVGSYSQFKILKDYDERDYNELRKLLRNSVDNLGRMVFVLEEENSNLELLEEFPLDRVKATYEKRKEEYKEFKENRSGG